MSRRRPLQPLAFFSLKQRRKLHPSCSRWANPPPLPHTNTHAQARTPRPQHPQYNNNQAYAQRNAAAVTQQQIRNAVDNPYPGNSYDATRAATATGQASAALGPRR